MVMTDTMARVKINGGITDTFYIGTGLKQGDGFAPMLFNMALDWVVKQTNIDLNNTLLYKSVQIVGYADDLDIMGRSLQGMEEVYKQIEIIAAKIGLQININKTKRMVQSRDRLEVSPIMNQFDIVEEFKYLGTILNTCNDEWIEVQRRISQANKTYFALLEIMKSNCVHRRTKIKIYKTIIRNVICYGSETWVMTKRTEMALGAFERKILRRIFGPVQQNAQWRIRYNDELFNLYKDNDIVTFIKLRRLEWAGHVYRMEDHRIPKRLMEGRIYGIRPKGRPKNRWIDSVTIDARDLLGISA